jgi:hypothetical protein
MRFFQSWIKGSLRGQERRKHAFGQEGKNKRIRFSLHFDANSDEFNHLARTWNLFLGGKQSLLEPLIPLNVPLQPHPSIVGILFIHNLTQPIMGGKKIKTNPFQGMQNVLAHMKNTLNLKLLLLLLLLVLIFLLRIILTLKLNPLL